MTDYEKTIRDNLISLFNADDDTKESGTYSVTKWYRRVEDGLLSKRTPFCYVEFQRRVLDSDSSDISDLGYLYEYEIGVLDEAHSRDTYKADDNVTTLLDKVEDVLLENRTVSDTVDNLCVGLEKEFVRGRLEPVYQDISWGIIRVAFKKRINARQ